MRTLALIVLSAVGIAALLSFVVSARLFVYRHDQRWRRERGSWFGEWPMSHGWENVYRQQDYVAEGHRLIPFAIALQLITMLLAILGFTLLVRAV